MGKMDNIKKWTDLWLKYERKDSEDNGGYCGYYQIRGFDAGRDIIGNAVKELKAGIKGMLGAEPVSVQGKELSHGIVLRKTMDDHIPGEGYRLKETGGVLTVSAADESGLLYGVFHLLRRIAMEESLKETDIRSAPDNPLRMLNHWDNMDGSIERGYSGQSFFFCRNKIIIDERITDYARMAASIGINGVVMNNVNVKDAATRLITPIYLDQVAEMAKIFSGYGIRLYISLNFAAPLELGGPESADPLEEKVIDWWREKIAEVYAAVPGLGGFLVKADSEGRPGPFTYGRSQADGANMLADLIKPYGGIIIWRCFVYNCTQDWRDRRTDRARAGYDNFITQDGDYHRNVILQIKNGPMDFQVREPVSPLLGGLKHTNQMLEVQIAQEYTGHQIDICYLIPMFKQILDFHTYCAPHDDQVARIISGKTFRNPYGGMAAVCNTGDDSNWTGNDLAAANLYGFGRLSYQTSLTAEEIAEEWIRMTFSGERQVVDTVKDILMSSWPAYEKYTSPLGIGWMVEPHSHYGPNVDGYEYSRWGTYHRADHLGIGMDRSETGTGYVRQYYPPNGDRYNDISTCPEELLLFFHHVPYTHRLSAGKTVIQHIYDSHFEGVIEVEEMITAWEGLDGKVSGRAYVNIRERLAKQLQNAREWRDQVNSYFYRKSGVPDEKGRMIY